MLIFHSWYLGFEFLIYRCNNPDQVLTYTQYRAVIKYGDRVLAVSDTQWFYSIDAKLWAKDEILVNWNPKLKALAGGG